MRYLVIFLLAYLVYKYFRYLYRLLGFSSKSSSEANREQSNLRVDHDPNSEKKNFSEGEYIDYEEVKE